MPEISIKTAVIVMLAATAGAAALAETIAALTLILGSPWIAAATVHSLLALVVIGLLRSARGRGADTFGVGPEVMQNFQNRHPRIGGLSACLPAVFVAGGASILAGGSALWGGREVAAIPSEQWAWIIWIPLVEELTYRVGVGFILRQRLGILWGSYLSALLFALMHSQPTIARMLHLQVGLPLGPLLLAALCEGIYLKSGKIWPAVCFHMACNATPVIFATIDIRWLSWLQLLYLGG